MGEEEQFPAGQEQWTQSGWEEQVAFGVNIRGTVVSKGDQSLKPEAWQSLDA